MKKLLFIILLLFSSNIYSQIIPIQAIKLQKIDEKSPDGPYYDKGTLEIKPFSKDAILDIKNVTYQSLKYVKELELNEKDKKENVDEKYLYRELLSDRVIYIKYIKNDRSIIIQSDYYNLTLLY